MADIPEETKLNSGRVIEREIEQELKDSFLDYAMSVIVSRALPDVKDGLKPVHRRILYAMNELGVFNNKPYVKSARIVGECFVKDTMVLTEKGLFPIQNIKKGDIVYTQTGTEEVSELFIMPKRKLLKVSLENGTQNIATKSQKFKVLTDNWEYVWKEAKDLKSEDYIVVKSSYPKIKNNLKFENKELNDSISYLLGFLISDGWVEKTKIGNRLCFQDTNINIIKRIESILISEFEYCPTIEEVDYEYLSANGLIVVNKAFKIRINRKEINDLLVPIFNLAGVKADTKTIPTQIFCSPANVIFSFISGLVDGDGCIKLDKNTINYTTISKTISSQLIILLQHFGIYGSVYETDEKYDTKIVGRNVKKTNKCFNLEFRGMSAHKLASKLDLAHSEKSKKSFQLLEKGIGKSNNEILPFASEKIFQELSESHLGGGWYKDKDGKKFREGIKHPSGVKIRYAENLHERPLRISQIIEWGINEKLKRIGSETHSFIKSIIRDDIYFIKVKNVEEVKEEITYDIQVKNKHEFVANGMVVHNCMGKFHPHGDLSIYDALVRMAQDFSLRYTLIQGQGNFGSIDGDPAAAMRYSEARLQKIAEDMLEDLNKETVDFGDNYDGKLKEPLFLPAKVPNLLINGSSGIAVGMATNILPHNLKETCDAIVHMIDSPNATINELLNLMKGPDLPTAGIICGTSGIKSYFKTGRGKVVVKSKIDVEEKGNKTYLIVREIPYMVNKSEMIEQIADAVKDGKIEGISDIKDESSRQGMRIVFALKSNANTDVTLNQLFKHSRLKESYGVNIVALVNNQPRTLNIRELIEYFIMHRKEVVTKRAKFDLREAEDKAHKLEGLKIALDHIDAVVALIKASKSPEEATLGLMKNFKLTEIQAKTILDMRLQRLTGLEQEKIRMDLKETLKLIEELKKLLSSVKLILGVVKKETLELKEKYGDERRTLITSEEDGEIQVEDLIEEAQTVITITHTGYIKRLPLDTYKSQKRGGKGVRGTATKDEDFVEDIYTASTHDHLLLFTNFGKLHWIKVHEIPEASRTSKGKAIINLIPLSDGEKVTAIVPVAKFDPSLNLIGATKQGTVKKTSLDEYSNPRKGGIAAITLEEGDELVAVALTTGNDEIMLGTAQGNAVRFNEKDARPIGRTGKGVRGVRLDDKDEVIGMIIAQKGIDILTITENGYGKRSSIDEYRLTARGGKGVINIKTSERNGNVVSIRAVTDKDEVMFISKNGIVIRTPAKDISQIGRNTQGLRLMRLEEGDKVVSMTKVVEEEETE